MSLGEKMDVIFEAIRGLQRAINDLATVLSDQQGRQKEFHADLKKIENVIVKMKAKQDERLRKMRKLETFNEVYCDLTKSMSDKDIVRQILKPRNEKSNLWIPKEGKMWGFDVGIKKDSGDHVRNVRRADYGLVLSILRGQARNVDVKNSLFKLMSE